VIRQTRQRCIQVFAVAKRGEIRPAILQPQRRRLLTAVLHDLFAGFLRIRARRCLSDRTGNALVHALELARWLGRSRAQTLDRSPRHFFGQRTHQLVAHRFHPFTHGRRKRESEAVEGRSLDLRRRLRHDVPFAGDTLARAHHAFVEPISRGQRRLPCRRCRTRWQSRALRGNRTSGRRRRSRRRSQSGRGGSRRRADGCRRFDGSAGLTPLGRGRWTACEECRQGEELDPVDVQAGPLSPTPRPVCDKFMR
jgi:hypothetical protein